MEKTTSSHWKQVLAFRWNPGKDLLAIAVSWILVVGSLYSATVIVGQGLWGGFAYFLLYALLGATVFGVGLPLYWTIFIRRKSVNELGITSKWLIPSLILQLAFGVLQYFGTFARSRVPVFEELIPLIALALAIGFFEAVFWRGWVLLRLEEAFGLIPAILIGSILYAAYHIGYAMPASEMVFLFFIGIMYAIVFRLTKSIFILWPFFQPMGQLVTLVKDQLSLPLLASVGFVEVMVLMFLLVWLAERYYKKHIKNSE